MRKLNGNKRELILLSEPLLPDHNFFLIIYKALATVSRLWLVPRTCLYYLFNVRLQHMDKQLWKIEIEK